MPRTCVEYWEKWGGQEKRAMEEIVRAFNCDHPRYEVVMHDAGDWASSPDLPKFLAAQAEGKPPDIIGLEDHQIVDLASAGSIVSLPPDIAGLDDFAAGFRSLGTFDGTQYGVPVSADLVTLYVNLAAVPGSIFEDGTIRGNVHDFVHALAEYDESHKGIGLVPSYPGWWPHAWTFFFGGSFIDGDGAITLDEPNNAKAMAWIRTVRDRLVQKRAGCDGDWVEALLGNVVNLVGPNDPDPFLSGQVAMVFEGDWLVRKLVTVPAFDWRPSPFPCHDGRPGALVVADLLAIPSGAENPDGASEFIRFASSRNRLEQLALGQLKVSPLKDWSQEFLHNHPNTRIGDLKSIMDSSKLFHDPRVPGWLEHLDALKRVFADVWLVPRDDTKSSLS